jgi:hypothetical protein
MRRELRVLRKRFKENEHLLQHAAIKCEHMQGVFDDSDSVNEAMRDDLQGFRLARSRGGCG